MPYSRLDFWWRYIGLPQCRVGWRNKRTMLFAGHQTRAPLSTAVNLYCTRYSVLYRLQSTVTWRNMIYYVTKTGTWRTFARHYWRLLLLAECRALLWRWKVLTRVLCRVDWWWSPPTGQARSLLKGLQQIVVTGSHSGRNEDSDWETSASELSSHFDHQAITSPVESAPFFILSTSSCSLSSWFTLSCAYHLITVTTFAIVSPSITPPVFHSRLKTHLFHKAFPP